MIWHLEDKEFDCRWIESCHSVHLIFWRKWFESPCSIILKRSYCTTNYEDGKWIQWMVWLVVSGCCLNFYSNGSWVEMVFFTGVQQVQPPNHPSPCDDPNPAGFADAPKALLSLEEGGGHNAQKSKSKAFRGKIVAGIGKEMRKIYEIHKESWKCLPSFQAFAGNCKKGWLCSLLPYFCCVSWNPVASIWIMEKIFENCHYHLFEETCVNCELHVCIECISCTFFFFTLKTTTCCQIYRT